jgi:hypothetical protein
MDSGVFSTPASPSGMWTAAEPPRLSKPASLILILALSIGLWVAIWAGAASLASAVMG